MHYFKDNKTWKQITREERLFCAQLYFQIENRTKDFVEWLIRQNNCPLPIELANSKWEAGYEVCMYRDWIKEFGWKGEKSINRTEFASLKKRTFDLCLFSERNIILIEAKAKCGYDRIQLPFIEKDKEVVARLLGKNLNDIFLVSIHSSLYKPRQSTLNVFDGYIHWLELLNSPFKVEEFERADNIRDSKSKL